MSNPDAGKKFEAEFGGDKAVSLEEFSLSNVMWNSEAESGECFAEAENEIDIAGKRYSCKFEMWKGNNIKEVGFVLSENSKYKEWLIEGTVKFDEGAKYDYTSVYTSIARNRDSKDGYALSLPDGTGMVFYKKMLEYIERESVKYEGGLLHKVIHDPKLGLDLEKWNEIFEAFLTERGYRKVKEGNWRRLYKNKIQ